ncbi:hypothetical protein pb186bvf_019887 [Paramecium bursaria]
MLIFCLWIQIKFVGCITLISRYKRVKNPDICLITVLDRMNSDLIRTVDNFHVIEEQYMHLWPPVKDDLKPQRDYLFVNEGVWHFFVAIL